MDQKFDDVIKGFSNKQQRVYKKIQGILGSDVAAALVSMQGVSNTSQQEIDFVANLISSFAPYQIVSYKRVPTSLVLEAVVNRTYKLRVYPQYSVRQPDTCRTSRSKNWFVDVVLELFATINNIEHQIGIVGYEYDGHIGHYVQDGVRDAYVRDAGILQEKGFNPVRVSPEGWKANPTHYIKSLEKHIQRSIIKFERIQSNTAFSLKNKFTGVDEIYEAPVTCALCNGAGKFGGNDCPCCKGMGSLSRHRNEAINLEKYEVNACPKCIGGSTRCKACKGTGKLSREEMLAIN